MRSIAIIAVIIFHIWPRMITGGFIGVDIFFVISGFLITSIINKELSCNNFTFKEFYKRRIKRILPVFYVMILITYICAYVMLANDEFTIYVKSVIRTCIFISNIYFIKLHNNYFAPDSSEYPLLHTWSLSVEEQYYLVWPLVLLGLSKMKKHKWLKLPLIFSLFLISYSISIHYINGATNIGYYSTLSRAFELMVGSILSIIIFGFNHNSTKHSSKPDIISTIKANLIALTGFLIIILSMVFFNEKSSFPGFIALIPTLGTAFIIYAGYLSPKSFVNKVLATRPFVIIGILSYSMYLWHWPLLAFWRYYHPGQEINYRTGIIFILITCGLASLSYIFIEKPIKQKSISFKQAILKYCQARFKSAPRIL